MSDSQPSFITITDPAQRAVAAILAETADTLQTPAAIVGGFIRDTLLGRPTPDLDIVVFAEGDLNRLL